MIVIAIIGILTTIVFSTITKVREKARDGVRTLQINQIVKSFKLYYSDKGQYPGSDIGLPASSAANYCLGLNDGYNCWPHGNPTSDPAGYAAHGSTDLNTAMKPYISSLPYDPLHDINDYGDVYIYTFANSVTHNLSWTVETCSPDVIPPTDGTATTSPVTCQGGSISKLALWYGPGCQYKCVINLDK